MNGKGQLDQLENGSSRACIFLCNFIYVSQYPRSFQFRSPSAIFLPRFGVVADGVVVRVVVGVVVGVVVEVVVGVVVEVAVAVRVRVGVAVEVADGVEVAALVAPHAIARTTAPHHQRQSRPVLQ